VPYIPDEARDQVPTTKDVGLLTYHLYQLCVDSLPDKRRFADFASLLGALEATKLELYRQLIAPYEDVKLAENGPVKKKKPSNQKSEGSNTTNGYKAV
jgi:hypothetical protein